MHDKSKEVRVCRVSHMCGGGRSSHGVCVDLDVTRRVRQNAAVVPPFKHCIVRPQDLPKTIIIIIIIRTNGMQYHRRKVSFPSSNNNNTQVAKCTLDCLFVFFTLHEYCTTNNALFSRSIFSRRRDESFSINCNTHQQMSLRKTLRTKPEKRQTTKSLWQPPYRQKQERAFLRKGF